MKEIVSLLLAFLCSVGIQAQDIYYESLDELNDSVRVDKMMKGDSRAHHFANGKFTVTPPSGHLYVGKEGTNYLLSTVWGNPEDKGALGCIIPDVGCVFEITHAYIIYYSTDGYVKDDDASSVDYDNLLQEMKDAAIAESEEAKKLNPAYPSYELLGWAEKPYYDKDTHRLHWAKLLKFENNPINTINYDIRVLGRKGFVLVKAVADESELPSIKENGKYILNNIKYDDGYCYEDFDESSDHIAEWTIGGLIAGKVLTKLGFWALIAKFWKYILIGGVALLGGAWKKLRNKE